MTEKDSEDKSVAEKVSGPSKGAMGLGILCGALGLAVSGPFLAVGGLVGGAVVASGLLAGQSEETTKAANAAGCAAVDVGRAAVAGAKDVCYLSSLSNEETMFEFVLYRI